MTNNEVEFKALLLGLTYLATDFNFDDPSTIYGLTGGVDERSDMTHLCIQGDSELAINQMQGKYQVVGEKFKPLYHMAQRLIKEMKEIRQGVLQEINFEWIPPQMNVDADYIANCAIGRELGIGQYHPDNQQEGDY